MKQNAWVVRPYPDGKYRVKEFLENGIAAIGWPNTGDLKGCDWEGVRQKLLDGYSDYTNISAQAMGQRVGIIHRFINDIREGDAVLVPDGGAVYFSVVANKYSFHPQAQADGYPHWIKVDFQFDGAPLDRNELPEILYSSLKGRQTVFNLPSDDVWKVIDNPRNYSPIPPGPSQEAKLRYTQLLSTGKVPGINSTQFELAVRKVLSLFFPGLERLATTNAEVGADTDLKTALPGQIVVRVQVKCFQDAIGLLGKDAVIQLRNSMEEGEHGIVVTSGSASPDAEVEAAKDNLRPIGLIGGPEFADLVFENYEQLSKDDLWALGLHMTLEPR